MIKLSDYIVKFLEYQGVENVFMLVGGGSMHLNDSIGNSKIIKYISCLHEQSCAMAAESYARCKRDLGVAIVTTGPGATNTVTGISAAWIESTPLFVLSGQVKRSDSLDGTEVRSMGVQEVDIVPIVKSITKYSVKLNDPYKVLYELEKCVWYAKNGRPGPVLMDIPLDVQATLIDETELEHFIQNNYECKDEYNKLGLVANLIRKSQRPVIYAGGGVYLSGGQKELIKFAEKLKIPVMTTWNGIDNIWEEHPLYMGRPGAIGQRSANFIIQNCDLLITIGTRLASLQTGFNYDDYARNAKIVMVDIDQAELDKKKIHPEVKICMDAKCFLKQMIEIHFETNNYDNWIERCRLIIKKFPNLNPDWLNKEYVNSYYLVDSISRQMTKDDIYCGGRAGTCVDTIIQAFKVKEGQRVIATKGLSSMGYGIPAAIGAAVAYPGHQIICNNGDGGFVMNIQELATIAKYHLPIKFFVLNNNGYATIVATQTNVFNKHFVGCTADSGLCCGNIIEVAKAYGMETFTISSNNEIDNVVHAVLKSSNPVVCDVKVSITQKIEPRQASFKNKEGQMQSRVLEDMKPLLETKVIENINKLMSSNMEINELVTGGG